MRDKRDPVMRLADNKARLAAFKVVDGKTPTPERKRRWPAWLQPWPVFWIVLLTQVAIWWTGLGVWVGGLWHLISNRG